MTTSFGKYAVTASAVFALGGLSAITAQAPAQASGFSAAYTCNISNLGQVPAVLNGWLSSPGTAFNGPASFRLHISSLNLQSPIPIDSWSATAWINVGGAENTTFQVAGGGGSVPAQGALAGDLVGDWAPVMGGTDFLRVGGLEITANSAEAGSVPVQCVPNGAPVAEVLRVASPYHGRWIRPAVPIFHIGGWYRPGMTLHRPVWIHPGRPGGWNRPGGPGYPGGWNRPGAPGHPGGWNRPGIPIHPGHPIVPVHPGGWNRPGIPVHPGHPVIPVHPGGWNRPGIPVHPGHPVIPVHPGGWNRPGIPVHPGHPVIPVHPGGWNRPGIPIHHGGPIGGLPHHH
ncbi:hypothetical protein GCM10027176_00580 [Actinoallomurus bryophytorum]|uniref:Uncharacterized protein n=1 Tax=Actinoallomurus bryophytorum TaxID=1490222 RepID=A0A543CH85_9ACTN|nr:hypothetical protein [Actinoallomurus bryophytorum]TQL96456.1 hypothetical protein FB559_1985 [Actinoallomurus bryophytorum]